MKKLIVILFAVSSAYAQYAASASGSTTAAAEINSKPATQTGAGAPTGNCTEGKDFYNNTTTHRLYRCSATDTWAIMDAGISLTSPGYLIAPFTNYEQNGRTFGALQPQGFMYVPTASLSLSTVEVRVMTASGTCAGTCGLVLAVYDSSHTTKLGQTTAVTSGGSPNLNTTGELVLTFSSPVSLTANTPYWFFYVTDSTSVVLLAVSQTGPATLGGLSSSPVIGYCSSNNGTGSGSSVSGPSSCTTVGGLADAGYYSFLRP